MQYVAEKDGYATVLSRDEQFDEYLDKGCSIYSVDGEKETLIATPEDGFLTGKTNIGKKISQSSNTDLTSLRSDVDFITMMTGIDL